MRDIASNIGVRNALSPAVQAATIKGNTIDRKGFESVAFVINSGAIAGAGLYAPSIQHSDTTTDGDFTNVDAKFVIGTLPVALEADKAVKVGYVGHKRYTRIVLTKTSGTSVAAGAVAILGDGNARPVE